LVGSGAVVGAGALVGSGGLVGSGALGGATDAADDDTDATLEELAGGGALVGSGVGDAQPTTIRARTANSTSSLIERDILFSSLIFLTGNDCRSVYFLCRTTVTSSKSES
jgi:hypothetical protein